MLRNMCTREHGIFDASVCFKTNYLKYTNNVPILIAQ